MPSDRSFAREGVKVDEGGGGSDIALNTGACATCRRENKKS